MSRERQGQFAFRTMGQDVVCHRGTQTRDLRGWFRCLSDKVPNLVFDMGIDLAVSNLQFDIAKESEILGGVEVQSHPQARGEQSVAVALNCSTAGGVNITLGMHGKGQHKIRVQGDFGAKTINVELLGHDLGSIEIDLHPLRKNSTVKINGGAAALQGGDVHFEVTESAVHLRVCRAEAPARPRPASVH